MVQGVEQGKDLAVGRNVGHGVAIVHIAYPAVSINDHLGRHSAILEYVHLLAIEFEHTVPGIGQAGEREVICLPVVLEGLRIVWAHDQYLCAALYEERIVLAQLRHVPAAERSGKASVEHQHNRFDSSVVRESHHVAPEVTQAKVRGHRV